MSVVGITCPRCGSPSNLQRGKTDEFVCSNCGAVFRFVDPTRKVVTKDVLTRNCLHCGKPIEAGKGFKCTRCRGEFFCDSCVDEVQGKYVCANCLITSQENCQFCKKYAVYKCANCGRRACRLHPLENFAWQRKEVRGEYEYADYYVEYCPTCRSFVCRDCGRTVGIFFQRRTCPKCHTTLGSYGTFK